MQVPQPGAPPPPLPVAEQRTQVECLKQERNQEAQGRQYQGHSVGEEDVEMAADLPQGHSEEQALPDPMPDG